MWEKIEAYVFLAIFRYIAGDTSNMASIGKFVSEGTQTVVGNGGKIKVHEALVIFQAVAGDTSSVANIGKFCLQRDRKSCANGKKCGKHVTFFVCKRCGKW